VHRIDPRAKLITTLAFIVFVTSFNKYALFPLLPFAVYPLILASAGQIPLGYIARRILWLLPFVVTLGAFNPFFDHRELLVFGTLTWTGGWVSFITLAIKLILTASTAMILLATTGFPSLCRALDSLMVPRVFVVQLLFLHRYLFVLAEEVQNVAIARKLRGGDGSRLSLRSFGSAFGHLAIRTFDRAKRIHLAMICRGFDGEFRQLHGLRFQLKDALFVLCWCALFLSLRFSAVLEKLGRLCLEVLS